MTPQAKPHRFKLQEWGVLRGQFHDSGGGSARTPWRFSYRPPAEWRIEYGEGTGNELITNGRRTWVVEAGVGVVLGGRGEALVNNKLFNLVTEPMDRFGAVRPQQIFSSPPMTSWDEADVYEGEIQGRSAWMIGLEHGWELGIDQLSGVGLRLSSQEREIGIERLELDPALPAGWFDWSGPEDLDRRPGVVYVGVPNSEYPDGFRAHWEVCLATELVYSEVGPSDAPVDLAVAWARERAGQVIVRTVDLTCYSAGEVRPEGQSLSAWPR